MIFSHSFKRRYLRSFSVWILLFLLFLCKVFVELKTGKETPGFSNFPGIEAAKAVSKKSGQRAAFVLAGSIFGMQEVLSDVFFLETIQYFGDWRIKKEEKFKMVSPLFKAISILSPDFVPAYYFGALVFDELGKIDEAIKLLDKGIEKNPHAFELWLYRDFTIYLFRTGEYEKAIQGIKTALTLEGHPPVLERILAYAYEKNGQIEEAINQWQKIYLSTEDERLKEICVKNIKRLKGEKEDAGDKRYNFHEESLQGKKG